MGYECPVCETPQADGRHLADHLAMTAMVRGGDHEAFLDERVDGWSEMGPDELAPVVTDYATEREYPQVFEDTTDRDPDVGVSFEEQVAAAGRRGPGAGRGDATAEHESILREAVEMTERMLDDEPGVGNETDDGGASEDDSEHE